MRGELIPQRPKDANSLADAVSACFYNRSALAQQLLSHCSAKKDGLLPVFFITNMVGDRRIELLTSSVSRKRSTSELIAQRDEILLANVRPVNSLSGFGALPSQLPSQRLKLLIFSV